MGGTHIRVKVFFGNKIPSVGIWFFFCGEVRVSIVTGCDLSHTCILITRASFITARLHKPVLKNLFFTGSTFILLKEIPNGWCVLEISVGSEGNFKCIEIFSSKRATFFSF